MGDVDRLVPFSAGKHLNFSAAQPSDKLGNDALARAKGDSVDHISQVQLETGRDVDSAQSSLEARDFEASCDDLLV